MLATTAWSTLLKHEVKLPKPAIMLAQSLLDAEGDAPESAKEWLRRHKFKTHADRKDHGPANADAVPATRWPEWEDLDEWQRVAAQEMENELNLVFALVRHGRTVMELESKRGRSFVVFENEDEAEAFAVNQVEGELRAEPRNFNQDWLQNFINVDQLRHDLRADEENNLREQLDDQFPDYESKRDELLHLNRLERDVFYAEDEEGYEVERPLDDLERVIDNAWD